MSKRRPKRLQLDLHYSGELSTGFWNIVNTLPKEKRLGAYSLGVALQNLEGQVLKFIHDEGGPGLVKDGYWFNRKEK